MAKTGVKANNYKEKKKDSFALIDWNKNQKKG